ncbi:MAG: (d)CMP kinase [Paracoccaceae bacterium]
MTKQDDLRFCVAIDGPAGAGKGTLAERLAERFGFAHLDTGLLYRAVGKLTMDNARGVVDETLATLVARDLKPQHLTMPGLRTALAARAASKVAAFPEVRRSLLDFQRDFARRPGGAVLDGRDIGSVVVPTANVKFYVTASVEERARRRHAELTAAGETVSLERLVREIAERDHRDETRPDAPLTRAADAHLLDTTDLDIEAAAAEAAAIVETALGRDAV